MFRVEPYDMKMRTGAEAPNPLFCANPKSICLICLKATLVPTSLRFGDERPDQLRMMLTMAIGGLPLDLCPCHTNRRKF